MIDLFNYRRRSTSPVQVGDIQIGGDAPIRVQSMTTTNTNDTEACVAQAERIIKALRRVAERLRTCRTSTHNCVPTAIRHRS